MTKGSASNLYLPDELREALAPHAARRGLPVDAIVRLIVGYALRDDLVDAILDDDGGAE